MSTGLSRKLRNNATEPEQAIRRILKTFRAQGLNFRRQVLLGSYYVYFACLRPAIVIEIDGDTHSTDLAQANDSVRDDYLTGRGFRVLRFWNNDIMTSAEGVFAVIEAALANMGALIPPPQPSRREGGGGSVRAGNSA